MTRLLVFFPLILSSCAHYMHERVHPGMSKNDVREELGAPDMARVLGNIEGWTYTVEEGMYELTSTYELVFENGQMIAQGRPGAAMEYATALEMSRTPHERCSHKDEWKRHGDMKTCLQQKSLEAQNWAVRQQQEAAALESRRAMAAQILLSQPAPVYQPYIVPAPAQQNMQIVPPPPVPAPRQPVNCTSTPNGFGGVQTRCY